MKRSAAGRGKARQQHAAGEDDLTGAQAAILRSTLEQTGMLPDEDVLRLLNADRTCEGLYSKSCKVRRPWCRLPRDGGWGGEWPCQPAAPPPSA